VRRLGLLTGLLAGLLGCSIPPANRPMMPRIIGPWWTIARVPNLGPLNGPPANRPNARQEPVDFSVWQAADGTWQLWSCIRNTRCGGTGRLLHRWEGPSLTTPDWKPMGIAMQADPRFGETAGGLQAPYVLRIDRPYHMFYGDWEHICLQRSQEGKSFERWLDNDGRSGMFTEGPGTNTRDPMVVRIGTRWHCYYTAHPRGVGSVFVRTSTDLRRWSESKLVARGGLAGRGMCSAECPQVIPLAGCYYLFRTQRYSDPPTTCVYRSLDPLDFGVDNDDHFIGLLPVAAPEIIKDQDEYYIAALLPDVQGIQVTRLAWMADEATPTSAQSR